MHHFKALIIFLVGILAFFGSWWLLSINQAPESRQDAAKTETQTDQNSTSTSSLIPNPQAQQNLPEQVLLSVPFTSQSPFGDWDDPRQQDACEEASIIIADYWLKNKTFSSKQEALDKILEVSNLSAQLTGTYVDTSAADTQILLQTYTGRNNTDLKYNFTNQDIKQALAEGHLVIVPTNGQKLGNPYFTGDGPERHMLVIIGYNENAQQFITHDVGTRQGENYKYSYTTLYNAIADYPTGDHQPANQRNKAMIVVKK